jgi:Ulp1 family protease
LIYPCNYTNTHWFTIVVDFEQRTIKSYDSLGINHANYLTNVENSLRDEAINRQITSMVDMQSKQFIIIRPFTKSSSADMPRQNNYNDCGVFTIMLINFIIDEIPLQYLKQEDMNSYRLILACDIIRQKLNYYYQDDQEKDNTENSEIMIL